MSEARNLRTCEKQHGNEGNAAAVYGHHGSVRTCIRLYGSDEWVYDPRWEDPKSREVVQVASDDLPTLKHLIEVAHEMRRELDDAGWRDEVMTLAQHWSSAAGWLAQRIRYIERGDEPDMPDAMRSAPVPVAAPDEETQP